MDMSLLSECPQRSQAASNREHAACRVSLEVLEANAETMKAARAGAGPSLGVLQLDDGYAKHWGDWKVSIFKCCCLTDLQNSGEIRMSYCSESSVPLCGMANDDAMRFSGFDDPTFLCASIRVLHRLLMLGHCAKSSDTRTLSQKLAWCLPTLIISESCITF